MDLSQKCKKTRDFPLHCVLRNRSVDLHVLSTVYTTFAFPFCSVNSIMQTPLHLVLSNRCHESVIDFLVDKSTKRTEFLSVYINQNHNQKVPLLLAHENNYSVNIISKIVYEMEKGIGYWVDCFVPCEKACKAKSSARMDCSNISANMQHVNARIKVSDGIMTPWCGAMVWVIDVKQSQIIVAQNRVFLESDFLQTIRKTHVETSHDSKNYEEAYARWQAKCTQLPTMLITKTHQNMEVTPRTYSDKLIADAEQMAQLMISEEVFEQARIKSKKNQPKLKLTEKSKTTHEKNKVTIIQKNKNNISFTSSPPWVCEQNQQAKTHITTAKKDEHEKINVYERVICMSSEMFFAVTPCFHMCLCKECSQTLMKTQQEIILDLPFGFQ